MVNSLKRCFVALGAWVLLLANSEAIVVYDGAAASTTIDSQVDDWILVVDGARLEFVTGANITGSSMSSNPITGDESLVVALGSSARILDGVFAEDVLIDVGSELDFLGGVINA